MQKDFVVAQKLPRHSCAKVTRINGQSNRRQYRDPMQSWQDQFRDDSEFPTVEVQPQRSVFRRAVTWPGMGVEFVRTSAHVKTEFRFHAPLHLLVVYERGARRAGETCVEGLRPSTLRNFARKLTFVPAAHDYSESLEPGSTSHIVFFYFDAASVHAGLMPEQSGVSLEPRLFFEDATLWGTALKLSRIVESPAPEDKHYLEALGSVLVHELVRLNQKGAQPISPARGGLAAWQQRILTDYIEERLSESVSLRTLSNLVNLSPSHFCRAFKQSVGMPPHRYHTSRRIERAKVMLVRRSYSVTEIGLAVGYSETSSFTAAFRKATGITPTDFHRKIA